MAREGDPMVLSVSRIAATITAAALASAMLQGAATAQAHPSVGGQALVAAELSGADQSRSEVRSSAQRWPTCMPYIVIGMRGSGQTYTLGPKGSPSAVGELGPEIAKMYWKVALSPRFKGKTSFMGVASYSAAGVDATAAYLREVINYSGANLITTLGAVADRCPRSRFILAGYSQGAYAVRAALVTMETGKSGYEQYLPRISAAVVLADPGHPNAGVLYLLRAIADKQGIFSALGAVYATVRKYVRIPLIEDLLAVAPLARSHRIAGTPTTVPFQSVGLPDDIVGQGYAALNVYVPIWRDVFLYNTLGGQFAVLLDQAKQAHRTLERAVEYHSMYRDRPTYIHDNMSQWIISNAR